MKEVIGKLLDRMNKIDLPDTGTFTCLKQTMSFYLSQDDNLMHGANWIVRDFEQIDGDILRSSKQKAEKTCYHFVVLVTAIYVQLRTNGFLGLSILTF